MGLKPKYGKVKLAIEVLDMANTFKIITLMLVYQLMFAKNGIHEWHGGTVWIKWHISYNFDQNHYFLVEYNEPLLKEGG